jgi:hypothetical protein
VAQESLAMPFAVAAIPTMVKIDQSFPCPEWQNCTTSFSRSRRISQNLKMTQTWQEAYRTAILETDWTRIRQRLQTAEYEIRQRQHVFSLDHGGTHEERQAIADALRGMECLRTDVTDWQRRKVSDDAATTTD